MIPRAALRLALALGLAFASQEAAAQSIVLDRAVRAGGLVVFPSADDGSSYYYAPTRAKLARDEAGRPHFSFLRYVQNVTDGEGEVREGEGGGIVHAVVELGVSEEDLETAERELRQRVAGARITGPVIFRSGRFGLVSSFQEGGELATRVVGLGSAPILDGGRAAVSIHLTRTGSKLLWQSFQTATPDVSFLFEMELPGLRAPRQALIEADLDVVQEHRAFAAGVATTFTQTEIKEAFDGLYRQGAIRVVEVGEDEDLAALVQMAYSKLVELIFQPATDGVGSQALAGGEAARQDVLTRASNLLDARRKEARDERQRVAEERRLRMEQARREREVLERRAGEAKARAAAAPEGSAERLDAELLAALSENAKRRIAYLEHGEDPGGAHAAADAQPAVDTRLPELAIVATYEMKTSRQRGLYSVDLSKYTEDTLSLRFDENIGDLRRHLGDPAVFRSVNLDDPLYRQREVTASLVGVDAGDFGEGLAFVSVQLRKQHGNGEESHEEVRIDRSSLNATGNRFKLTYGWKGDDDRSLWQRYSYRALWTYAAGGSVEGDWREASFNVIPLAPPYQRRTVEIEGLAAPLADAGVRSVSVRVIGTVAGREQQWQTTLNTARGELSKSLEFLQPSGARDYEYEIQWRLTGNRSRSSGRHRTDQDLLYVDEVPAGD